MEIALPSRIQIHYKFLIILIMHYKNESINGLQCVKAQLITVSLTQVC